MVRRHSRLPRIHSIIQNYGYASRLQRLLLSPGSAQLASLFRENLAPSSVKCQKQTSIHFYVSRQAMSQFGSDWIVAKQEVIWSVKSLPQEVPVKRDFR
jgi:hypothetical protein